MTLALPGIAPRPPAERPAGHEPALGRARRQQGMFLSTIHLSAAVAVALVWIFIGLLLASEREHAIEHTRLHVQSSARLLADNAHSFIRGIDVVLLSMQDRLDEDDLRASPRRRDAERTARIERSLRLYVTQMPELDGLYVIDAAGNYLYANTPSLPAANVADRPHFQFHQQQTGAGLHISQPVISRSLKQWSLVFTRRLSHADGSFAGMLAGTMLLSHFDELYRTTAMGGGGVGALYDARRHLLARSPRNDEHLGRAVDDPLLRGIAEGAQAMRVGVDKSVLDGVERMRAIARVEDYPLYTVAGIATESYEAEWRKHMWIYPLVGALISALLLGFARYTRQQVRKELASVAEVSRLNKSLEATVAELRLANREQGRLTDIVDSSDDAILSKRPDGTVLTWNRGAERMFGYAANEIVGQSVGKLFPPEAVDDERALITAIVRGGHVAHYEATRLRKDGRRLEVSISMSPVLGDGGETVAISAIMRDISERKRLDEERRRYQDRLEMEVAERTADLRRRGAELETANRDLEGFSYSVSHDLRAPLRAIDGFIAILREDYAPRLDAEGMRLFGIVSDNARKMGHLIDDILAFSRAGRLEMVLEAVDMNALVDEVWTSLATTREGRAIEFNRADLPGVVGDIRALRQVWQNLLANAIKFTRDRRPARIEVDAETRDGLVWYRVKDNGAGFKQEYQAKLFGLFQRLHGMDEFEGTGVGLAIVKRFIQKHGGQVSAEGVVDAGATLGFGLPVQATPQSARE